MEDDAGDDRQFSQAATLRDGTPVTLRTMRPDDRERIVAAFSKLDPGTIYIRASSRSARSCPARRSTALRRSTSTDSPVWW